MIHLKFEEIGYRDALGRFVKRERILATERDKLVTGLGDDLVHILRRRAPRKSGKFAEGIRAYGMRRVWWETELLVGAEGEHGFLLPFIKLGTRPHIIPRGGSAAQLAKGYPLSFYWEKGPRGPGWYHFWSVQHPGTKANPFIHRSLDEWRPSAADALRGLGIRVVNMES